MDQQFRELGERVARRQAGRVRQLTGLDVHDRPGHDLRGDVAFRSCRLNSSRRQGLTTHLARRAATASRRPRADYG